ncbi:innate immunity activator b [Syngnathus scovelli]|uniref:innate immunity activator b n=1 Tax=Syngnathus scovelli TaxID=161590 RepID=UPI0021104B41|nr:innate immunity activator b [Syngnathus scovelli]XP_049589654.1 innate immunity activator b [Syngnathus scovelli]
MEGNGEISDTDSGIILHSGSDSPTSHTKDVNTHTRAMKLKHQALQDSLELCLLELKKLCIREAELTGRLSGDYPLLPGEKPPQIRRRIGAAFMLDEQSIPRGVEESALNLVDAELALQFKIYEAARKLCEENHLSKAVRKSRLEQCKREEKKLKQLQETAFQLRLEHGRSSPLPAFNIPQQDLAASDDSSLSDSVVHDEEVQSESSQPSTVLPYSAGMDSSQPATASFQSHTDGSYRSPSAGPQNLPLTPRSSPHPSLDSSMSFTSSPASYDLPPIQHSPWSETSLDQPYQKSKKSRSSCKASPSKNELLPPLEACLPLSALPQQLSHLKLSRTQSHITSSMSEKQVHRQLSLRRSNPESSLKQDKERGRPRGPRRRLTDYIKTPSEASPLMVNCVNHAGSEDSNSEHSFASYSSSPSQELLCDFPKHYQATSPLAAPFGRPQASPHAGFYHSPRHMLNPGVHKAYYNEEAVYSPYVDMPWSYYSHQPPCSPSRYEYRYKEASVPLQRAPKHLAPDSRHSPTSAQWDHPQYRSNCLPQQVVNEQLKSWHRRSQLKGPRSRSLDRQGAVRVKSMAALEAIHYPNQKYQKQAIPRRALQIPTDDSQGRWLVDDGTHYMSQV